MLMLLRLFERVTRDWGRSPLLALAVLWGALGGGTAWAEDFLPPEQAFALAVRLGDSRTVILEFDVAKGYYLYRERFGFEAAPATVRLDAPSLPPGHVKFDETFQKEVETYRDRVEVHIPVIAAPAEFVLTVTSQGCADQGLCYPPQRQALRVQVVDGGLSAVALLPADQAQAWVAPTGEALPLKPAQPRTAASIPSTSTSREAPVGSRDVLGDALLGGQLWRVAGVFLVAGLLLSLTPCVLPMLPILSSIIVGQGGAVPRWRGLMLSALYVLGMASVYTALGVLAGLAGEGLAARLQQPAVLLAFAGLMVVLALSMFGVYELRLPAAWQTRVSEGSARLAGGQALAVLLMGGLSALIVSPCVAAPLAGALVFISQTGNVWLGGVALFSLALGMGVPLLLVGASAGRLLPRTGAWMETVKQFFGLILLGVAVWIAGPVLPVWAQMLAWAALLCLAAAWLWQAVGAWAGAWAARGACLMLTLLAAVYVIGALSGGRDILRPLGHLSSAGSAPTQRALPFVAIKGIAGLEAALARADRPVMLDFYADWCVSCKEMEAFTFPHPEVERRLAGMLLLRADVTANDADDRALLKRFDLFGPPGIVFFGPGGAELRGTRVVGYQAADEFVKVLDKVVR